MNTKKKIKKYDDHNHIVKLNQVKKYIPLVLELRNLLEHQEVKSVQDFEEKVNGETNWKSARLSAEALGLTDEYNRMMELEKQLDNKLDLSYVDDKGELTKKYLDDLKEQYTIYFTPEELEAEMQVEKVIKEFAKLPYNFRKGMVINNSFEIQKHPLFRY